MKEYIMQGVELLETIETPIYVENPNGVWLTVVGVIVTLACMCVAFLFFAEFVDGCAGCVFLELLVLMVCLFTFMGLQNLIYPPVYQGEEVTYRVYIHNDTINYAEFEEQFEVIEKGTVEGEYIIKERE